MADMEKNRVLDDGDFNADWTKSKYDLGIKTLPELAKFMGMQSWEPAFKIWLRQANKFAWVDNAPHEIRVAIRAHKDYSPKKQ